jgi:radical SAM protein with 4Fe4S-binding SPASM domain
MDKLSHAVWDDNYYPLISSSAILRKEYYGGVVFNPDTPPEVLFDHIRFNTCILFNGKRSIKEIRHILYKRYLHSQAHLNTVLFEILDLLASRGLIRCYTSPVITRGELHISGKYKKSFPGNYLSAPSAVILETTGACNLRCRHCLTDNGTRANGELTFREITAFLDQVEEEKIMYVNFTGGEPLIRKDILDIIKYASKKNFAFDLSTNGLLIDQPLINELKKTRLKAIQISLDGLEDTHDWIRDKKSAFCVATNSIRLLRENNFSVVVSTTITRKNLREIPDLIDYCAQLDIQGYKTTLFIPSGRGTSNCQDLLLSKHDVYEISGVLSRKEQEYAPGIFFEREGLFDWVLQKNNTKKSSLFSQDKTCCAAGTSILFVTANGDVKPCPFLRDFNIGNIRKLKLSRIWHSDELNIFRNTHIEKLKGNCKNCGYLGNKCNGGCRAAALHINNDFYAEDPNCFKELVDY